MKLRIAILDLYEGQANEGMRCIRSIISEWSMANQMEVVVDEFDVRLKAELPSLEYDAYISSGGPGSPLDSVNTTWEKKYFHWIHSIEKHNHDVSAFPKKPVFFICHSFQLACRYFKIATVCKRYSTAFGVFPVHATVEAADEKVFEGLADPFYAVDSRDYQVIRPNHNALRKLGGKVLAIEKERPHVPFERAVMAIRFNEYFIGTQFHPEADAIGMSMYLQRADKKETVIKNHGEAKWQSMIDHLNDPDKILLTYQSILPNFLTSAVELLVEKQVS